MWDWYCHRMTAYAVLANVLAYTVYAVLANTVYAVVGVACLTV